jgi:hypothetical protein
MTLSMVQMPYRRCRARRIRGAVVENSYWSRLWIVQEVLLAKRLSVQIGAFEVDWYDLLPEKSPQASRDIPVWSIGVAVS